MDNSTGRFISSDPAKDGLNWFTYAKNNPTTLVDPTGLMTPEEALAGSEGYTYNRGTENEYHDPGTSSWYSSSSSPSNPARTWYDDLMDRMKQQQEEFRNKIREWKVEHGVYDNARKFNEWVATLPNKQDEYGIHDSGKLADYLNHKYGYDDPRTFRPGKYGQSEYGKTKNVDKPKYYSDWGMFQLSRYLQGHRKTLPRGIEIVAPGVFNLSQDRLKDDRIGFDSLIFRITGTDQYIYGVKGTDPPSWADWVNNLQQEFGFESEQYDRGYRNVKQIVDTLKTMGLNETNLQLGGYSLGGGVVSIAGTAFGIRTNTFNPAPVNDKTLDRYGITRDQALNYVTRYNVQYEVLDMTSKILNQALGRQTEFSLPYTKPLNLLGAGLIGLTTGKWGAVPAELLAESVRRHGLDAISKSWGNVVK